MLCDCVCITANSEHPSPTSITGREEDAVHLGTHTHTHTHTHVDHISYILHSHTLSFPTRPIQLLTNHLIWVLTVL